MMVAVDVRLGVVGMPACLTLFVLFGIGLRGLLFRVHWIFLLFTNFEFYIDGVLFFVFSCLKMVPDSVLRCRVWIMCRVLVVSYKNIL